MTSVDDVEPRGRSELEGLWEAYFAIKAKGLNLNLTRGVPSPEQLDLSNELLSLPGHDAYLADDSADCRNYGGGNQGIPELRRLFSPILGAVPDQVIAGNNSSLALMYDATAFSLVRGTCDSLTPWSKTPEVSFLCPVPGYDRHFRICEELGIRMISVPLFDDGPDMDKVEKLVANNPSIKGMWCTPKYSNPSGIVYSDGVIGRLAAMKSAAQDFRLYWDNAYAVHHLTSDCVEIANILELCKRYGCPNRPFVFTSTSKITLAGSGVALFAGSSDNVRWFMDRVGVRTIGPDKINQLRHVRFLRTMEGVKQLMENHRALVAPKFQKVIDIFTDKLSDVPGVVWTKPKGGYFITLTVPLGCARRVVALAAGAGVQLTPAGATHPYRDDPYDNTIRIAPTFPNLSAVGLAAEVAAVCVSIAAAEQLSAAS